MKATSNIKKHDLIWLNLSLLPKLRSTYIIMIFIAAIVFGYICIKNGFPDCTQEWVIAVSASLGGAVGGILFGVIFSSIFILFTSQEKNGILGKHEYELTRNGLHEKTSANEGLNKWEGITAVKKTNSYIYIQISSYLFHMIPKRSFESTEKYNEFYKLASKYYEAALNKSPD